MIQNPEKLPTSLRWRIFGSDWLDPEELDLVSQIVAQDLDDQGIRKNVAATRADVSTATIYALVNGRAVGRESVEKIATVLTAEGQKRLREVLDDFEERPYQLIDRDGRGWVLVPQEVSI